MTAYWNFAESNSRGPSSPSLQSEVYASQFKTLGSKLPSTDCCVDFKYFEKAYNDTSSVGLWDTSVHIDVNSDNTVTQVTDTSKFESELEKENVYANSTEKSATSRIDRYLKRLGQRSAKLSENVERGQFNSDSQSSPINSSNISRNKESSSQKPALKRIHPVVQPLAQVVNKSIAAESKKLILSIKPQKNVVRQKTDRLPFTSLSNGKSHPPTFKAKPAVHRKVKPVKTKNIESGEEEEKECISCGIQESPCWRPSWSVHAGQLCNSCGLRFRKSRIRCCNRGCLFVPSKLEIAFLREKVKDGERFACIKCSADLINC